MGGAHSATQLVQTGIYKPSRLPGNPLFEWSLAAVVPWGGHRASNGLVLLAHGLLVTAFWRQYGERPNRGLWTATLALTPIALVNATTTMDYLPGLAFALLGYTAACRGRPRMAALWLGLSIGIRLSNVLLALPVALVLADRAPRRALLDFTLLSGLIGGAFYLPIFWKSGLEMLVVPPTLDTLAQRIQRTGYNALRLFGPLASVGILALLALRARTIGASLAGALRERDAEVFAELAAVALMLALFVLHPAEPEYLLPIVPFSYLLMSRWLSRGLAVALCVLVLSDALFTVDFKGGESGRRALTFSPGWGLVVENYRGRREFEALRQGVARFDRAEPAVIMTGLPQSLTFENDGVEPLSDDQTLALLGHPQQNTTRLRGREVYLCEKLSREDAERLRAAGYKLFIFSMFAPPIALNVYHYDPSEYFERLEILNERAFYRQAAESPSKTSSGTPSAIAQIRRAFGVSVSSTTRAAITSDARESSTAPHRHSVPITGKLPKSSSANQT